MQDIYIYHYNTMVGVVLGVELLIIMYRVAIPPSSPAMQEIYVSLLYNGRQCPGCQTIDY